MSTIMFVLHWAFIISVISGATSAACLAIHFVVRSFQPDAAANHRYWTYSDHVFESRYSPFTWVENILSGKDKSTVLGIDFGSQSPMFAVQVIVTLLKILLTFVVFFIFVSPAAIVLLPTTLVDYVAALNYKQGPRALC
jgi:hypothetical protein